MTTSALLQTRDKMIAVSGFGLRVQAGMSSDLKPENLNRCSSGAVISRTSFLPVTASATPGAPAAPPRTERKRHRAHRSG